MHDVIVTPAQPSPVVAGTVTPGPFGIIHYLPNGPGCPPPARSEPDLAALVTPGAPGYGIL